MSDDQERLHNYCEKHILTQIEKVQAVFATRFEAMDHALELKTHELNRRLEGLNELREEVIRDRDQFARRDVIEGKMRDYDQWITNANETLTKLMVSYNSRITQTTIGAIISVVISLLALLMVFFQR